ncbi:hypothetical protein FsymDg_2735 [Candidatus Protofrankia datiscae]|uniref:Glycosyl transferase family 2 n=4 Tax=Protofrankia TaxID=2994361 RepID=F8B4V5_9ACTN|nr:hypothetical protein [Candidatus Protofrankia datiscae]AEH10078.1 hypothetical protein FsymDg_2735 [Candidatus Protofrankia datiscae]
MAAALTDACIINHNSSEFTELALRTLIRTHQHRIDDGELRITVIDNHSTDEGLDNLRNAVRELPATWERSPWPAADSTVNSHGDVLRAFVQAHEDASHLWFVDADIVFRQPDCLGVMLTDLAARPDLWAVQARFHWLESNHGPGTSLNIWAGRHQRLWAGIGQPPDRPFPGSHKRRCHPACALVANTPTFRRVTDIIGLSAALIISVDERLAGFADTLGLASLAMETHGLHLRWSPFFGQ